MQDVDITNDDDIEMESQNLSGKKKTDDRKPSGNDPIADWLLKTYY